MIYLKRKKIKRVTLATPRPTVRCLFRAEKFRSDGTITYKGPWFSNLVLDIGLDNWASESLNNLIERCNVGTGSSEPSQGQTGLDSFLASTDNGIDTSWNIVYTDPARMEKWKKWEFDIGSCTGNLTEVALSYESDNLYLNRQLFRDENGDPVTITVDDDEGLRVDGTVIAYSPLQDGETLSGSFTLDDSTTINYSLEVDLEELFEGEDNNIFKQHPVRLRLSDTYDGWTLGTLSSTSTEDYVSGSYELIHESKFSPGSFEGTVRRLLAGWDASFENWTWYPYHFRLDDTFDKTDIEELTVNWKASWGRY